MLRRVRPVRPLMSGRRRDKGEADIAEDDCHVRLCLVCCDQAAHRMMVELSLTVAEKQNFRKHKRGNRMMAFDRCRRSIRMRTASTHVLTAPSIAGTRGIAHHAPPPLVCGGAVKHAPGATATCTTLDARWFGAPSLGVTKLCLCVHELAWARATVRQVTRFS
jgi:hypothetical protein